MAVTALTAATCYTNNFTHLIPIVNAVDIQALATIEATVDLTSAVVTGGLIHNNTGILSRASSIAFHMIVADETGAVNFDVDALEGSHDGTNWETIADFGTAYDGITAAGVQAITGFNEEERAAIVGCKYLRLAVTESTAFDASNHATVLAWLGISTPHRR